MLDAPVDEERSRHGTVWVMGVTDPVTDHYVLGRQLGEPGQYGRAVAAYAVNDAEQAEKFAIKIISKARFSNKPHLLKPFRREVTIMKEMDHPNVINYIGYYEDKADFYIVMDMCSGGELFDRISKRERYTERDAAQVLSQLFNALKYIHSKRVAHCDLKPDNFIFDGPGDDALIKVIDFGMAKFLKPRHYFKQFAGTPYYVAPEVLNGHYDESCDMWSMGVVMFVMLHGYPPFYADPAVYGSYTDDRIYDLIVKGFDATVKPGYGAHFPEKIPISESARDLIARLLNRNMAMRPTASEVLEHDWMCSPPDQVVNPGVVKSLQDFQKTFKLKKLVVDMLARSLDRADEELLQKNFCAMDKNEDGVLTADELANVMRSYSVSQPRSDDSIVREVQSIIRLCDTDGDGVLNYREMQHAFVVRKLNLKEERLWNTFCSIDRDGDGVVSVEELYGACCSTQLDVCEEDIREIVDNADKDGDGCISYDEFVDSWMNNDPAAQNPDMDKSGYLTKRGGFIKNWKKRYFVARDDHLYYFKNDSMSMNVEKARGHIPIAGAQLCLFQECDYNKPYAFGMKPANNSRTYVLVAESDWSRYAWIDYLVYKGALKPSSPEGKEVVRETLKQLEAKQFVHTPKNSMANYSSSVSDSNE